MVMQNTTSRRHFLIDALRVTAGVAATGSIAAIAQTDAARNAARRVDFHHHFVPPRHLEAILAQRESGRTPPWGPEMSIEEMDKNGIATAIVSLVQPGIWLGGMENSQGWRASATTTEQRWSPIIEGDSVCLPPFRFPIRRAVSARLNMQIGRAHV